MDRVRIGVPGSAGEAAVTALVWAGGRWTVHRALSKAAEGDVSR